MCIEEEIAQRESVGLNTLRDNTMHCPEDAMTEVISRAILGSPHQRLYFYQIYEAIRERFRYFVIQNDRWPVSGIILFELFRISLHVSALS